MSKLIWCILYMQCNKAIEMCSPISLLQVPLLWCHVFLSFFYHPLWLNVTLTIFAWDTAQERFFFSRPLWKIEWLPSQYLCPSPSSLILLLEVLFKQQYVHSTSCSGNGQGILFWPIKSRHNPWREHLVKRMSLACSSVSILPWIQIDTFFI